MLLVSLARCVSSCASLSASLSPPAFPELEELVLPRAVLDFSLDALGFLVFSICF